MTHFDHSANVRPQCVGEFCTLCNGQANHKITEELQFDDVDLFNARHPFTAYVCARCFQRIFMPYADQP